MIEFKLSKKSLLRFMKLSTLTLAVGMLALSVQAKPIQLTMQHMEQPPSRVEAMQIVVDKFNEKYPDTFFCRFSYHFFQKNLFTEYV